MRYWVVNSAWFDAHPYNKSRIALAVRGAGGSNVRLANARGWSNQPKVVTFAATPSIVKAVEKNLERVFKTPWIHVKPKDW